MQQFQARGSLFCFCEELDPLDPKVRARCGGSSLLSGHELMSVEEVEVGEASSSGSSSAIAGWSLEYSVLRLDFVSMLSI